MDEHEHDRLLTIEEIAQRGATTRRTLDRLIAQGEGPPRVILNRRVIRFRQSDFDAWLASRTVGAAA